MPSFDFERAKRAGMSPEDIIDFLKDTDYPYDFEKALRAGFSPEDIITEVSSRPKWERAIDDEKGAGFKERFILGSANDPETKHERAVALYGEGNVFYDKDGRMYAKGEDGKKFYVNPKGADIGDIAGGAREIASVAGSVIPAFIPGIGLLAEAAAGSAAGAGAGQAVDFIAANMGRDIANKKGNPVPKFQTAGDAMKEFGLETALGTGLGYGLGKLGMMGAELLNPIDMPAYTAFKDLGLPVPSVGTVSKGPGGTKYENMLEGAMSSSNTINEARRKTLDETERLVGQAVEQHGGAGSMMNGSSRESLGQLVKDAAQRGGDAAKSERDAFYGPFWNKYADIPAGLDNVASAIESFGAHSSPDIAADTRIAWWNAIDELKNASEKGELNAYDVFNAKRAVGNKFDSGTVTRPAYGSAAQENQLYGALRDDSIEALENFDKKAAEEFIGQQKRDADFFRNSEKLDKTLLGRGKDKPAVQIGNSMMSKNLPGETVDALENVVSPEDWNAIQAAALYKQAMPTPEIFDPVRMGKALGGKANEYSGAGEKLYGWLPERENWQKVLDALSRSKFAENTSRTAQQLENFELMRSAGGNTVDALGSIARGDDIGALMKLSKTLGSTIGPRQLAELTTNQKLIDFLAKPQSRISKALADSIIPVAARDLQYLYPSE